MSRIFLEGKESTFFLFVRSLRQSNRNSRGSKDNSEGMGVEDFGISEGREGGGELKCSCCSW